MCWPSILQVYDLSEYRPDKVLRQIWQNLLQQEQQGNQRAALVRSRLRILACGGDGTIAWILKVIHQLDLQPNPAVAIMPLGTGAQLGTCRGAAMHLVPTGGRSVCGGWRSVCWQAVLTTEAGSREHERAATSTPSTSW